ncbi:hypothetical protein BDN70DRAFT_903279 [Pholiota conissans]|uniref:Mediator of RNA polymerase II transcription subunit 19 n=1 Tax=Pholiota conissans TaxID=109636 RepID=A0A9P6CZG8_9AGAR|nr:hypothetical protein BDN70DRAFT_903279 [Pholiota conissans]
MNGDHSNAVAGPSTLPPPPAPLVQHQSPPPSATTLSYPSDAPPLLFLPPPLPPPPPQHLAATQDLLARFNLLSAYDRYVRPFVLPGDDPALQSASITQQQQGHDGAVATPSASGLDKGKGRERDGMAVSTPADADHADAGDGDDDDAPGAKGEKKKKNSYKHLIKGIPGKHSLKKDDYLTNIMLVPPKQRMRIHRFDAKTQEDAFTVSLEGLKGWNVNALLLETAQAREDRKKRKELKRLAKLQIQQGGVPPQSLPSGTSPTTAVGTPQPASATSHVAQPQPVRASTPAAIAASRKLSGVGTPRPSVGTPRPGSRAANTAHTASVAATPSSGAPGHAGGVGGGAGVGQGRLSTRPGSAVPRPGSAVSAAKQAGVTLSQQQRVGTPAGVRPGTPMDVDAGQRGKKREREREDGLPNGVNSNSTAYGANGNGNGHANGNGPPNGGVPRPGAINAKAGTGNIRPRPIKKQRIDSQGAQPVQQQPTPQGV